MLKDVLILFVSFNPEKIFFEKVSTLNFAHLIVDNSENTNNYDLPNLCVKELNIHYNGENLGIGKALNMGCEYAISKGYKYVVTMDQDSIITLEIIHNMLEFADTIDMNQVAIISPRHVLQNDLPSVSTDMLQEDYVNSIFTMTSGNLLNLAIWQKISGFDNELFIDLVDIDYYCKAMQNGYKVITLNKLSMKHDLGNLELRQFIISWKVFNHNHIRKYYQVRNALLLWKRYPNNILSKTFLIKFLINLVISTILFEDSKCKKIKSFYFGFKDFLRNKRGKFDF